MKNLFFYILGLFIIASCEPSQDNNGDFLNGVHYSGIGTGGSTAVVKVLSKVTSYDDLGKEFFINYNYTGKKLTKVTTSNNSITFDITYNGDKISTIKKTNNNSGTITTETFTLTFNGNDIKTIERLMTENSKTAKTTATFIYSSGKPIKISEYYYDPADQTKALASFISTISYAGNNVRTWNYKAKMDFSGIPVPIFDAFKDLEINFDFNNYDNKKNPFSTLPKDFTYTILHTEMENNGIFGFSSNNAQNMKFKIIFAGGNDDQSTDIKYVYDSDGYPTSMSSMGNPIYKFEYKKL